MEIKIAIIALIVSMVSFLFALSTHIRQVKLQVVQRYQEMRIEVYDMILSLWKIVRKLPRKDLDQEQKEEVKALLTMIKNL